MPLRQPRVPLRLWCLLHLVLPAVTLSAFQLTLIMRLVRAAALIRLTAACGLFWSAILFTLTLADVLSRLART